MPDPDSDLAINLWQKSCSDERTYHTMAVDPICLDETLGWSAEQAAEKMVKAILSTQSLKYPRTHDLPSLLSQLGNAGVDIPAGVRTAALTLTEWSGTARYEQPILPNGTMDRALTSRWLKEWRAWATAAVIEKNPALEAELDSLNATATP